MKELKMKVVHASCAGIDVGSRFHKVAIGQELSLVAEFGVCTEDHDRMAAHLQGHGITHVAMESTGPYWQTLFDSLQRAGFSVTLVNGGHTKNLRGRKTDTIDCMWIQKLHSLGLLGGSFLPSEKIQPLRTYYSHRQHMVNHCSKYVNKMRKALSLMNIRLDTVLNDVVGVSGRRIIGAILGGERDPAALSQLADYRVRKGREEIARALHGNWREDLLFELGSSLELYDVYKAKIAECDRELERHIGSMVPAEPLPAGKKSAKTGKQNNKHSPAFDVEALCERYYGVNLMEVPSVGMNTVLCLLSQVGDGMGRFPSAGHFCSWLRLAPNNMVTGGKVVSSRTPKGKNRLALALRQAANSIGNQTKGELSQFFRRVAFKKGRGAAITATARKMAVILYNMVTKKESYRAYAPPGPSEKSKNRIIKNIRENITRLELSREQLEYLFLEGSKPAG